VVDYHGPSPEKPWLAMFDNPQIRVSATWQFARLWVVRRQSFGWHDFSKEARPRAGDLNFGGPRHDFSVIDICAG